MAQQFSKPYIARAEFVPAGGNLNPNTPYFLLTNPGGPSGDSLLLFKQFVPQLQFAGTNANTRSIFALQIATGMTGSSGTTITPTRFGRNAQSASIADVRFNNAGFGTLTNQEDRFFLTGIPSQQTIVAVPPPLRFEDENLMQIAPGESLVLCSHNTLVTGCLLSANFMWYEVP